MSTIKIQQLIAKRLLKTMISTKDTVYANPFRQAIVAGGAPRNWYMNRVANDIDIFLQVPDTFLEADDYERGIYQSLFYAGVYKDFKSYDDKNRIYKLGKDYHAATEELDPYTGSDPSIIGVWEGIYVAATDIEIKVQFVVVKSNQQQLMHLYDKFPTDISKVAFDETGTILASEEFLDCVQNETIVYDMDYMSQSYLDKLRTHFPRFSTVPKYSKLWFRIFR